MLLLLFSHLSAPTLADTDATALATSDSGKAAEALADLGNDQAEVKQSLLPNAGYGAFARRRFSKGESLGAYLCTARPVTMISDLSRAYVINATHSCDAAAVPKKNPLSYANSIAAKETCGKQNAAGNVIVTNKKKGGRGIAFIARVPIAAGDELLIDYGRDLFKVRPLSKGLPAYECGMQELNQASARGDLAEVKRLLQELRDDKSKQAEAADGGEKNEAADPVDTVDTSATPSDDGWTPLMEAAAAGHTEVVQYLLEQGADLTRADRSKGRTAIMLAAMNGHAQVVRALLDASPAPAVVATSSSGSSSSVDDDKARAKANKKHLVNAATRDGSVTALMAAAELNEVEVVRALLAHGATDPNKADVALNESPLYRAAKQGHDDIVRLLVERAEGANAVGAGAIKTKLNKATKMSHTPLFVAAATGHPEVVKILLAADSIDANRASLDGATPFFVACSVRGVRAVVAAMLASDKVEVDKPMNDGVTPLWDAVSKGRVELARAMLDSGRSFNVNAVNKDLATPLYVASQNGEVHTVVMLLKHPDIDVNKRTAIGASPLLVAAQNGHVDVVRALLTAPKIRPNLASDDGTTPLFTAADNGHADVVEVLLAEEEDEEQQQQPEEQVEEQKKKREAVDINKRKLPTKPGHKLDFEGFTPLLIAIAKGRYDVIEAMLKAPTSIGKLDLTRARSDKEDEFTPLAFATKQGFGKIIQLLLRGGADAAPRANRGFHLPTVARKHNHTAIAEFLEQHLGEASEVASEDEGVEQIDLDSTHDVTEL